MIRGSSEWLLLALVPAGGRLEAQPMRIETAALETELAAKYTEGQRAAIARGLAQAAEFWRSEDGDAAAFAALAREAYAGEAPVRDALF